jgi:outer membrane protein assembly factor BamB
MGDRFVRKGLIVGIIVLFIAVDLSVTGTIKNVNTKLEKEEQQIVIEKTSITNTNSDDVDWWPMFHHDPGHSGYSNSTGPETNAILWKYSGTELYGDSSPAVVNGKVYFGSGDFKVYCLDANTGEWIWDYPTEAEIFLSSPAVANDKVYIGSLDSKVYCLNANTGAKIWDYTTGNQLMSSPAVADGKVYICSLDDKIYCLDANTGEWIWDYTTTNAFIISSPAVADGKVYFGSADFNVYCLDADTGEWIWEYLTGNEIWSSPTVIDGKVYIGSLDKKIYCLNAITGAKIWDYQTENEVYSSPAVADGKVYIGSGSKVYCLNANNGAKIWDYLTSGGSFVVADGKVYIGSGDKKIYCLDANNGTKIWDYLIGNEVGSSPAVANGNVYLGFMDSSLITKVYCFGENQPPDKPDKPSGPLKGKINIEYNYTTNTTDLDDEKISYFFDWGDGTYSGWLGPYESGQIIGASHAWVEKGNYQIKVKARDIHDAQSDWSDILTITITKSKNKVINIPSLSFLQNFIQSHPNLFPILRLILRL